MLTLSRRSSSKRSRAHSSKMLERLEARTLLSAVIALTGNGTAISTGESTPAFTDFTNFGDMSTTATAAIGTISRTYKINNTGDVDLHLTGSPTFVAISGANAGDFLVSLDASASDIVPGGTASFTVSFIPLAAGLRQATVSIASDDASTPTFTFDIQGSGLTTTDSLDGLQIATTVSGTGSAAISGSHLTVNYTGFLTTGLIFDSSDPAINPGRVPFDVVLGRNSVIQGWEEGLLGMQAGETRTLIIPSALAYGPGGQGNIPGNAPLIFTVSALNVLQPTIAVSSHTINIANGESSPSATDFTDFGFMSTTSTLGTVTRSYVITNSSSADLNLTGNPDLVTISGANAGDFTVTTTPTGTVSAGNSTNFVISFTPQAAGLRSAVVTIPSTDPDLPSFTFDIQGTGLITANASNGLMTATITPGSGLAAVAGSNVNITYTGSLFNGAIFASATDSGSAFSVVVGASTLAGLNQGLLGIQPGETRTLIFPPSLGFGSTAVTGVPANSPLIYTVTAQSVQAPSSIMTVTANGSIINNGDTTPIIADFTDFGVMSTTVSPSIGTVTRTYTINDNGSLDLILSGGLKAVTISGLNKADFTVVTDPATTINAASHSSFTIAFTPHAAGLRHATVTIVSNDPSNPAYTFSIQGTGVATNNSSNGLQVASTVHGTGTRAIVGAHLIVDYTGFLLDGTIFDSSLLPGHTPLSFNIGVGQVIPGWDLGLAGLKGGESRVLIIPAALAYGNSGSTNIPPNSTLIFTVTASASSVINPSILVTGNGLPITNGINVPSTANGTILVTPVGSKAPVTVTITVASSNLGFTTFPKAPAVDIPNRFAANFSVSSITNNGSTSTFTLTFTPSVVGSKSAFVRIHSADPAHPLFTFNIKGTFSPYVDLNAASIGTIQYPFPGTVISGAATKFNVPVTVSNLGNIAVPANTPPVSFSFFLHDLAANTDTLISSQTSPGLRGLAKGGKSRTLNFGVAIPASIPTGTYEMKVIVDNNSASQNTNTANDSALSSQAVGVTQGFFNLTGVLASSTLPLNLTAGTAPAGKFNLQVDNTGNLKLPAGQTLTLNIIARPASGPDFLLKTSVINVASLAPGQSLPFSVSGFNAGIPAGTYQLLAQITPVQALAESSTADNLIRTKADGTSLTLTVT